MFKGEIPLTKSGMENLCKHFGLSKTESTYLDMLRLFNESRDSDMALSIYNKIIDLRKKHGPKQENHELEETQLRLLEKWYYLPILSYIGLKGASSDVLAIVKAFKGQITVEEASEAIRILVDIKLLRYTDEGVIENTHDSVSLLDGIPRQLVKKFHSHMINKAHDAISGMPQEKRYLMSSTINVKSSMLPEIKKKISKFMVEICRDYSVDDADSIYQLNTQFFNLAVVSENPNSLVKE